MVAINPRDYEQTHQRRATDKKSPGAAILTLDVSDALAILNESYRELQVEYRWSNEQSKPLAARISHLGGAIQKLEHYLKYPEEA
jgi:hypothetical protein